MIQVEELDFTYPEGRGRTLKDLDFSVREGEVFGFLGPSGAGKSTTQNVLIGLLKGYRGRVTVMGRELGAWGPEYYEEIGVAFELPNHYLKLTARENLEYFRSLYSGATEEPRALLELVGLEDAVDVRVGQFSKGMKVRLNFARSLLARPRLLFLDEVTMGLDPGNARRVKDLVRARRDAGATVFLTTHNMAVADELCDRVAFIVDGEIALIDSPESLKLSHGERRVRVDYEDGDGVATRTFALDGLGRDEEFLMTIRERRVLRLHSQETSLEQVFLEVTGRGLE